MKSLFAKHSAQMRFAAFVAVALIGIAAAAPAMADPHGHGHPVVRHRGGDWDRHVHDVHHGYGWHPGPGVVYAPPAVVEAPPPQPAGLNLIIPFNIR